MRVLVVSQMYPRPDAPAYAAFVRRQVEALAASGVEVEVCAPMMAAPPVLWWHPRWRAHGQVPLADAAGGVHVARTRYYSPPGMRLHILEGATMRRALLSAAARWRGRVDLVHANRLFPEGYAALALGRALGVPVVAMARGMDLNLIPAWGPAYREALRVVAREAHGILSVSGALLADLAAVAPGAAPAPRAVIYNGVDPIAPADAAERRRLRERFGLPLEVCLAGYVGRLEPDKGTPELLRAFGAAAARVPGLHLAAVGEPRRRGYASDIAAAGLAPRVHLLGVRHPGEIRELVRAFDFFVFPSRLEGVPNALLEAMAAGLACVATRAGGIAEVLPAAAGLLVAVGDVRALEEGIVRLALEPALRAELGARARAQVLAHHSWAANAEALKAFYARVLGAQRVAA
jgi:glycosyltransferase involved in cell wall biosynthesis